MLNIIRLIKKNTISNISTIKRKEIYPHRRDIAFNKEWYNSVYAFDKNLMRFLPAIHEFVFRLLKMYFNTSNECLNTKKKSRNYKRKKSFSNKVWVSTPEIKHLNKKAIITVYTYNRLYNQYRKQLDSLQFTWGPIVNIIKTKSINRIYKSKALSKLYTVKVTRKIETLRYENLFYLGTDKKIYNNTKNFYVNVIKWLKLDKLKKIEQYKLNIIELIDNDKAKISEGLNLLKIERYNYLINQFKKELIYLKLRQNMLFNKLKFSEIYLDLIIPLLESIYKKKIEFNIVILKNYYSSSSILSQLVTAKVKNIKNRGKALRVISKSIDNISIPVLSSKKLARIVKKPVGIQNLILNQYEDDSNNDLLNKFLLNNKKYNTWSSTYIDSLALKYIENKVVAGIFIKTAGRLTKRYKAERALKLLKYKGTLKNVYSSYKGNSSTLSRGYSNINVEKTLIHSKVRIGSFGLTGWVASY